MVSICKNSVRILRNLFIFVSVLNVRLGNVLNIIHVFSYSCLQLTSWKYFIIMVDLIEYIIDSEASVDSNVEFLLSRNNLEMISLLY